ncbi:hypothetical protein BH10BAC3_BH10BAC3_28330 [soil metagenome]
MKFLLFFVAAFIVLFLRQPTAAKLLTTFSDLRTGIIGCAPKKTFAPGSLAEININDNRHTAGEFRNGIFYLELETRKGAWYPESHEGYGLGVYAFAEKNKPLQLPGPVIRVPEGTEINAKITNNISEHALILYGFYSRPGNASDSIVIAPGKTQEIKFNAGVAGTYFYRAAASDSIDGGLPWFNDSQLYGAFIVDPPKYKRDPAERIFVIGIWNDTLNGIANGGEELVMNGLSWPYTERLTYMREEHVNWRLINASNQVHPMHLHGFFFKVNSKGHLNKDEVYSRDFQRNAVTELLYPGETITMTWVPEREGNWLFHCHTLVHIMPGSFLRNMPAMDSNKMEDIKTHAHDGMGGLIMGIHVNGNGKPKAGDEKAFKHARQLSLIIGEQKKYFDTLSGKGFKLLEKGSVLPARYNIPGPPLVLTKDEPVAIKVINKLKEATSMHWHGLEIESYFDGVAGWGNKGNLLAPIIQPGDSFTVHLTPPRAGTYIYHTHMHNMQLLDGMCGPLIVLNKGEKFVPERDKIFLISQGDEDFERRLFLLNGTNKTDTISCKIGKDYRFRLINISALGATLNVSLLLNNKAVDWRLIAKDGANLPPQQCIVKKALKQTVSIGETMDFSFIPKEPGEYVFELQGAAGRLFVTKIIEIK